VGAEVNQLPHLDAPPPTAARATSRPQNPPETSPPYASTMASTDHSAGILLYRTTERGLEVFLGHMGGPFWAKKDDGAWSIPKGLIDQDEDALAAAKREFDEEIGTPPPAVDYALLGDFRYTSGKVVTVFAAETDFHVDVLVSNTFTVEWPRGTGRMHTVPELDQVRWIPAAEALTKLVKGQVPVISALRSLT
jgi:predicted NUDIX family NTP pyrophosphohydrolase